MTLLTLRSIIVCTVLSTATLTTALPAAEPVRLTDDGSLKRDPRFVNEGKELVYCYDEAPDLIRMMRIRLDEPTPKPMFDNSGDKHQLEPFFSPDGKRICWRRFAENGATAEVYSMDINGGDVKRLTNIGAMSWAPYYHPSGDYLIFTTNKHGFGNFELYLVRADGKEEPVRVTDTDGFDGLPVFLPDGKRLSWTSTRTAAKQSQIFMADWDDAAARQLLKLDANTADEDKSAALAASTPIPAVT